MDGPLRIAERIHMDGPLRIAEQIHMDGPLRIAERIHMDGPLRIGRLMMRISSFPLRLPRPWSRQKRFHPTHQKGWGAIPPFEQLAGSQPPATEQGSKARFCKLQK